jgi:Tol biopolymer transport system component
MLSRVALESANLIKVVLLTAAATLAICLLALVEATNTAEAEDSLPENGKIAFESFPSGRAGRIYTVEPDGSNERQLTILYGTPKWSPDGTEILFGGTAGFSVMSADGSNLRIITDASGIDPTWSADGRSVAFSDYHLDMQRGQSRDKDIFMVDLDNLNQTTLRRTPKLSERSADFSPDGSQVCFTHSENYVPGSKPSGIYVMDVQRSEPTLLFEDFNAGPCDWSPDGKKIVFGTNNDPYQKKTSRKAEVYIINADGSGLSALTSNSAADLSPAWSPDSTKIAFNSDRDGDYDIYTMDVDGSDVAQVTNSPADDYTPDWQPLTPKSRSMTVHPPDTGGTSLLLVASVLFISGGTLLYAGLRRSI